MVVIAQAAASNVLLQPQLLQAANFGSCHAVPTMPCHAVTTRRKQYNATSDATLDLIRVVPAVCSCVISCSNSTTGSADPELLPDSCVDAASAAGSEDVVLLLLPASCLSTARCFLCSATSICSWCSSLANTLLLGSSSRARCKSWAASE